MIWIASANSVDLLPASILGRLLVLRIPSPDVEQVHVIVDGLYEIARECHGGKLAETLTGVVRTVLARHTPRRAGRILELAIGFALTEGRAELSVDDIFRAACLAEDVGAGSTFRHPVGFNS